MRPGKGQNQLTGEISDKQSTIYPLLFIQLSARLEQSCCSSFEEFVPNIWSKIQLDLCSMSEKGLKR